MVLSSVAEFAATILPFPPYIAQLILAYLPVTSLWRFGALNSSTWQILNSDSCEWASFIRLLEITDGYHPLWTPRLFAFGKTLKKSIWPRTWTATLAYVISQQNAFVKDDLPSGECFFNGKYTLRRRYPSVVQQESLALGILAACFDVDKPWNDPQTMNHEEQGEVDLKESLTSRLLPFLHRSEHEHAARTAWLLRWALSKPDAMSKFITSRAQRPLELLTAWAARSIRAAIPQPDHEYDFSSPPASFWSLDHFSLNEDTSVLFTPEELSQFYLHRREQRIRHLLENIQNQLGRTLRVCDDDVISACTNIKTSSQQKRNVVTIFGDRGLCFMEVTRHGAL